MASHTTQFLFDDGEYFAAVTTTGVRVGMNGVVAIEFPAGCELFEEAMNLDNAAAIEAFIDAQIEAGRIPLI